MSAFERIRYEVGEGIALVTLARPEKRNALDERTLVELGDALRHAAQDSAVRVVLLRGEGPDFCAGADLEQLERIAAGGDVMGNLHDAESIGAVLLAMRRHPKPIVAAVHGHAFAGGAGLATACDIVLASSGARFGYPEVRLGFVPAMVMALLRRTSSEKIAFELAARGDRIDAAEAQRLGLVNRVIPDETFDADVAEYVRDLAARSPDALRLIKRLLYGIDGVPFEEAIARGAEVNVLARQTEECREGVRRFLDGRKDS